MSRFSIPVCMVLAALLGAMPVHAHSVQSGAITVGHIWAYAAEAMNAADPAKGMPTGPVIEIYGPLLNAGPQDDAVIGVTSPDARAARIIGWFQGAQMTQDFPLALAPGKPVALGPQTVFIRLYGLDKSYGASTHFPVTFHFQHAADATIDVMVEAGAH